MSPHTPLYHFTDYRAYLLNVLSGKKEKNKKFSLRLWSNKLGLKTPSTLSMVLKGQRHPGPELTEEFIHYLDFSERESTYFRTLVRLAKVNGNISKKTALIKTLKKLNPQLKLKLLEAETFDAIANWYFFVIRELVATPHFKENMDWITKKLPGVTKREAKQAIQTMLTLKLLKRNADGKLVQTDKQITTTEGTPNPALQHHHRQMISRAIEAISDMPAPERELTGLTLRFNPKKLNAAKKLVREFRIRFAEVMADDFGNEIYQLNIQFFPLTTSGSRRKQT